MPAKETPAKLFLHPDFKQKHVAVVNGFTKAVKSTNSKWRVEESEGADSTTIRNLEDVRRFLLGIRRLPMMAGLQASFL